MESFVAELGVLLLAAFLLGLLVGYVWWIMGWRRKVRPSTASTVPTANSVEEDAALRARLQEAERQLERLQLKLKAAQERSTRAAAASRQPAAGQRQGPAPAPAPEPAPAPAPPAAEKRGTEPAVAEPAPVELPPAFAGDEDPFATLTFHPADFLAAATDSDSAPPFVRPPEELADQAEEPQPTATDEAAGETPGETADEAADEATDEAGGPARPTSPATEDGGGATRAGATISIPRDRLGPGADGLGEVPVRSDDLTRIAGVGTATSRALRRAGLRSYVRVAAASPDDLRAALEGAGIAPGRLLDSWPEQARLLADGDEEGLAHLRERLANDEAR
ncbi:MAG: hypothetical protein KY434_09515 [Actinobacteria bacterium]|nr:hypothetical protein [Actinomycetota bacterium]